jgi:hypothetical protein
VLIHKTPVQVSPRLIPGPSQVCYTVSSRQRPLMTHALKQTEIARHGPMI